MSFGIRDLTTAAVTPPFGAPTITPTPPSPTNSVVKGDGVDASRPPLRLLSDAAALSQLTADAGDATAVKISGRSESDDGALPNGLHVRHQSPMTPSSAPTAASSTSPAPANESWANRAWNFVVGDDIDNTFGKDKSVGQRLLGGLNLGLDASLVIPGVDIETGALKAAIKGGETAAKVVDGAGRIRKSPLDRRARSRALISDRCRRAFDPQRRRRETFTLEPRSLEDRIDRAKAWRTAYFRDA